MCFFKRSGFGRLAGLFLTAFTALVMASAAHAVSEQAIVADSPPKLLSDFGFFQDTAKQLPAAGVTPYGLNTALFSDGALKFRFVHLPPGQVATYDAVEAFAFPVGSALIKTFGFPADYRMPDQNIRLIETRVLLRHADGWQAWTYLWNEAQTDAVLKIAGARAEISTIDAQGAPLLFTYSVPNKNQCKGCHAFNGEIAPLGPKARNLNGKFAYSDGEANQIAHWSDLGLLDGAPAPGDAPAAADWRNASTPIDARARSWLDVNCAHCHRREGQASNSGLFLTAGEPDPVHLGVLKRPVAAGRGSGGLEYDIKPGDPDGSILIYRVESTEAGVMMPEIGRHISDPDAVSMLRDWVSQMR